MRTNNWLKPSYYKRIISFPFSSYRALAYLSTILTGFSALCAQIVWQKYLSILVGSESRSLTLVVSTFLFGLASGYYAFGILTEKKKWPRFLLLKYYGYTELLTAFYIGLFPIYFLFLKTLSFNSPFHFTIDILISLLALFVPTFLMGASIPILTATLPESSEEINSVHAKVYGWNALGACLGVLISAFYLLPKFGLGLTLTIVAAINLLASLVFIGNPLKGMVQKQKDPSVIPTSLPNFFYMIFIFFTGAVIISFEILFVRILNLSLGAGVYNFPMILSLFVGGLAFGSLTINKKKISMNYFLTQLGISICLLGLLFWFSPYWSIWLNHIRVSLVTIPSNYLIFRMLTYLFLFLFLFPAIFFMGRLLPLVYTFLKKNKSNYGRLCGNLYFFNTLGTVCGAIVIGYLALFIFDIDFLFKINIYILILLSIVIALFERKNVFLIALLIFTFIFTFVPTKWNRTGHYVGYFRTRAFNPRYHFKKLFFLPDLHQTSKMEYFKDGPNTTVTIINYPSNKKILSIIEPLFPVSPKEKYQSYSLIVNGKSDGNTLADFSTVFLMPSLSYLAAPKKSNLSAAVIGLGTGVSASVLAKSEDVSNVTVLEISPKVIEGVSKSPPSLNFGVFENPKVDIKEIDAFKFFTKTKKQFDIIMSEPSNPWVVGIENLFSIEFYKLASESLSKNGVLGQWLHTYDLDEFTVKIILTTLRRVFNHAELYMVGKNDIFILASQASLKNRFSGKRFSEPFLKKFYKSLGMHNKKDIYLAQILNQNQYNQGVFFGNASIHSITTPLLTYRSDKSFFLSQSSDPFNAVPQFIQDEDIKTERMKSFAKYKKTGYQKWVKKCLPLFGFSFLCNHVSIALKRYESFQNTNKTYLERFGDYNFLRSLGLLPFNQSFLTKFLAEILNKRYTNDLTLLSFINHHLRHKLYTASHKFIQIFKDKKLINDQQFQSLKSHIVNTEDFHKKYQEILKN